MYESALNKIDDMKKDIARGDEVALCMHALELSVRLGGDEVAEPLVNACRSSYRDGRIHANVSLELDELSKKLAAPFTAPKP